MQPGRITTKQDSALLRTNNGCRRLRKAQNWRRTALSSCRPQVLIRHWAAMDKAHQALVAFANKKKTPQTLAELADAIEAFAIQAQQVGQAVRTLVQL